MTLSGILPFSVFAAGHWEEWTEDVAIADGRTLLVKRQIYFTVKFLCGDEASFMWSCSNPDTHRIAFPNPDTKKEIRWEGDRGFKPVLLDVIGGVPYLIVMGTPDSSNMNKYGCPNIPYIVLRYREDRTEWTSLLQSQIPKELKDANLSPQYRDFKGSHLPFPSVVRELVDEEQRSYFYVQTKVPKDFESWRYEPKRRYLEERSRRKEDCLFGRQLGSVRPTVDFNSAKAPMSVAANATPAAIPETASKLPLSKQTNIKSFRDCPTCPEMIPIPGTNYAMGKYEVTQGEWDSLIDYKAVTSNSIAFGAKKPVIWFPWGKAEEFISKLSRNTGQVYRFPTQREWEHACYAGEATQFCGSDDVDAVAWHRGNSKNTLHEVGQKQPNGYGLYDMTGNVWEMTSDCWKGDCRYRVARGGAWVDYALPISDAYRYGLSIKDFSGTTGFRLLREMK